MLDPKVEKLLETLITKTATDSVKWEKESSGSGYSAKFGKNSVFVTKANGPLYFYVFNENGDIVLTHVESQIESLFEENPQLIGTLYRTIEKNYLKIDEIIDDILKYIE